MKPSAKCTKAQCKTHYIDADQLELMYSPSLANRRSLLSARSNVRTIRNSTLDQGIVDRVVQSSRRKRNAFPRSENPDALGYFIAAGQLSPAPLTIEERLPESGVANFLRVARALVGVPIALANLLAHLQGAPSTIHTLPNSGRCQSSSSATHNSCHLTRPANGSSAAQVSDRNFTKQLSSRSRNRSSMAALLTQQLGQPCDIDRDPPRLVAAVDICGYVGR